MIIAGRSKPNKNNNIRVYRCTLISLTKYSYKLMNLNQVVLRKVFRLLVAHKIPNKLNIPVATIEATMFSKNAFLNRNPSLVYNLFIMYFVNPILGLRLDTGLFSRNLPLPPHDQKESPRRGFPTYSASGSHFLPCAARRLKASQCFASRNSRCTVPFFQNLI